MNQYRTETRAAGCRAGSRGLGRCPGAGESSAAGEGPGGAEGVQEATGGGRGRGAGAEGSGGRGQSNGSCPGGRAAATGRCASDFTVYWTFVYFVTGFTLHCIAVCCKCVLSSCVLCNCFHQLTGPSKEGAWIANWCLHSASCCTVTVSLCQFVTQ